MPEIQMPKLDETMTEGTLIAWKKKQGDQVSAGEVIAEIGTDKAIMEWESPEDGVVTEIFVQEGATVEVGTKIAFIGAKSELRLPTAQKKEAAPSKNAKAETEQFRSAPVAPKPRSLPFYDPHFTWETFESFFCDFLAAHPKLADRAGNACTVVSAHPYGGRGHSQHGIDIRAEMSNGEVWVFQCKHYRDWGPKDTEQAIADCEYEADRKFLLVTRTVSPESREVIAKHNDWELWDSGDISREFLQRLPAADAAKILYSHFGPEWPKEMLGISGSAPLITAEAKFAPLLEEGRSFHHRLTMVGRREWLRALDDFVEAEGSRVFFAIGRGGLGKSRMLYEWSRDFAKRHPGWTLRFVSDSPADFTAALDGTSKPLVLVFDDAHRLDEVRRKLFPELPSRKDVKLVLALRPGPVDQVESEIIQAGFDPTHIQRPPAMKRLSSAEALQLAEEALGPELSERYRLALHNLSRDVPLLAVLAAELLKRGELGDRNLDDTPEVRGLVFEGLLRDARPIEQRFGETRTRDLLRTLAVLAPVKVDADFLTRVAALLGDGTQAHHVNDMLAALDDSGLLLTTGAGVRVSPDLLSDHLAYTACYDKRGRNTTFSERVVSHFPPQNFPLLMQHLAEAEWHASRENDSADSIVEPLWQKFVERFQASSFYARSEQLKAWGNIAHLQPRRTLELAELALQLTTAPPDDNPLVRSEKWDSHAIVLERLPGLLKPLAVHHPKHVASVLDILWQIGRDQPSPRINSQGHPITTIGEIASFQPRKPVEIYNEAVNWFERLFRSEDWIGRKNSPAWLLDEMLKPLFAAGMEETWRTGNTFHWQPIPLHLDKTDTYRDRTLAIIRAIAKRRSPELTLATLNVLEHAMRRAHLGAATIPQKFADRWLVERKKALALLAEIVQDANSPLIYFRARRMLLMNMRYEDAEMRSACREVFEKIPDELGARVVRATLGSYWDEFEGRAENWQEHAKRRWEQFNVATAESALAQWTSADSLLTNLRRLHDELTTLGSHPNFWQLLRHVANIRPDLAAQLIDRLIQQPSHPFGALLDALVIPLTEQNLDLRLQLCEQAIRQGSGELKVGAIACLMAWRQTGDFPQKAWELLNECAKTASAWVATAIIRFVWFNDSKPLSQDWELLAAIPVTAQRPDVPHAILERAADLLEAQLQADPQVVYAILAKLEELDSLHGYAIERGLRRFAKQFPGKVFLLVWRRFALREKLGRNFEVMPFDFENIRLDGVMSDPQAVKVIRELEDRFLSGAEIAYEETRLLQMAVLQSGTEVDAHLSELIERAGGAKELLRVCEFVQLWQGWSVVLAKPDFARALLKKARATDEEAHQKIFRKLQGLPGSRGSTGNQPDEEWQALVESVEKMAVDYKDDTELGPLYAAAAKHEREWMKQMCSRAAAEEDDEEE